MTRRQTVAGRVAAAVLLLVLFGTVAQPAAAAPCKVSSGMTHGPSARCEAPPEGAPHEAASSRLPRLQLASHSMAHPQTALVGKSAANLGCLLPTRGGFAPVLSVKGQLAPGALGLPGEQIGWLITVNNTGSAAGTDITVTDALPDALRIDSVEVQRGDFAISEQVVVFNVPELSPGERIQMRINTTLLNTPPDGALANRAQLSAVGPAGAIEDVKVTEVFVPTGLPATGYPPEDDGFPGVGEPSVQFIALVAFLVVTFAAAFVWWRGSTQARFS